MESLQLGVRYPSSDELMEAARAQAGLSDLGGDDFREGLDRFLASLEGEVSLSEASANQQINGIKRRLSNRLEIEAWRAAHPEVDDVKVGPPVSITGLPRTGTTALVNIMSLDDQFRQLRRWEQSKPCPPPVLGEDELDPRRLAAVAEQARMAKERPDLMAMHLYDVDATEEDVEVLGLTFKAQQFVLPIHEYHAWWRDADLGPTFAYHRRVIQLLQSRRPPDRWLFKAPAHNYHLEAFFKAYPDARVIMTHRDPAKAIPSGISFVSALQPSELTVDPKAAGRRRAEHLRIGAERAMEARARIGEDRFLDVHHRDFVRDPFGVIERIYDFIGMELTPQTRHKMEAWHAVNRTGAHGSHRYTAEQYGLSEDQLRADCASYIERYGIQVET